jgi:N6-L-threonylcarbamoyladenine synthase
MLTTLCRQRGYRFVAPPLELCTDNAVMFAWAGLERLRAGKADENAFDMAPRSRWPLDERAAPALGSGRRGAKA